MGPLQFHSHFIKRNDHEKKQHNIGDVPGRIGIDISGLMHRKLGTPTGAAVFDMEPKVPLYDAVEYVMKELRCLQQRGNKDVTVFLDGRDHPMKAATEAQRKEDREKEKTKLMEIYEMEGMDRYDKVKRLRTLIVFRRDDFTSMIVDECRKIGIKVVVSPFEADFQLVAAQQAGLIDVIVADDGDLFVLGADKIATELDYGTGSCCLYERSEILPRESMGAGRYADELAALSSFLGNDFVDRLDGNGPAKTRELMDRFMSSEGSERRTLIEELGTTRKWKKGDEANASNFPEAFWRSYNLQKLAPVFELHATSEEVDIDIANPDTYTVTLEPLSPLPVGMTREQWGASIGFGCDPSSLLKGDPKRLFNFEIMPKTGESPVQLPQPVSQFEPHYEVAHGANPDSNIPVEYWSNWALATFLRERGLRLRGRYNRDNSLRLAKRVLSLMQELGARAPQPREYEAGAQTAYDEDEPLGPPEDGRQLVWNTEWSEFVSIMTDIKTLDDNDFFRSFGTGRNGIQTRAQRLITGGHFNVERIQMAHCRIKATGSPAVAIRMECVPSMKAESYWVMFVVDWATKQFVPAPTSRCGCPAGLGGCSHLRAEYAVFALLQRVIRHLASSDETLTQRDAANLLPP